MLHNSMDQDYLFRRQDELASAAYHSEIRPIPNYINENQSESWISLQSIKDIIRMSTDCQSFETEEKDKKRRLGEESPLNMQDEELHSQGEFIKDPKEETVVVNANL